MSHSSPLAILACLGAASVLAIGASSARAAQRQVTITVENLAGPTGTAVAPLNFGFHRGSFDAFDIGHVASAAIQRAAELGSGDLYLPAFAAADPSATIGTVGGVPLLPGLSASLSVNVDTAQNPYFSFAAMVVPSNDFFLGNDSPTAYRVFDAGGNLAIPTIVVKAAQLWDAGTEVFDPAAAAFVGDATKRADQNSVVARNFAEFAAFNGLTTAAGYTFNSGMTAGSDVYRISFVAVPVPEPRSEALMLGGLLVTGWLLRRRGRATPGSSLTVA